jgi:glycosyltransferase involved in cell wall biosynthesis
VKASVILPTRNRPGWIGRAVESVGAQTHPSWELIVLDNSDEPYWPDGSPWADRRIRYVHRLCDGVADASNQALALATGEIIVPLGDDDRLAPQALERAVAAFTQWPSLRWMYGITELRYEDESVYCHRGHQPFNLPELRRWYYLGGAVYWRRSLTDRLGGYPVEHDGAADYALYLAFAEDSVPYWHPEVLYLYTEWSGTDSNVRALNQRERTAEIARAA